MESARGNWGSKAAFILVAAGSAVGLGNIWRFPYQAGKNGGAAFVLIYLLAAFTIGLTVFLAEASIGRATGRNPVCAFRTLKPKTHWYLMGTAGVVICTVILSYYGVIAGWTLGYAVKAIGGEFSRPLNKHMVGEMFSSFASNPGLMLALFLAFILITVFVVSKGVQKGIEKTGKDPDARAVHSSDHTGPACRYTAGSFQGAGFLSAAGLFKDHLGCGDAGHIAGVFLHLRGRGYHADLWQLPEAEEPDG